ncbi:MAG: ATPase, T2SS/T4P/T4SS family [Bacillota bacterium]
MKLGFSKNYLGDILIEAGDLTAEQLQAALQHQKEKAREGTRVLLGQTLIDLGFCSEEAISRALARKAGVPFLSLQQHPVDSAAANLVEPEVALRYNALPIGFEHGKLLVALKHPSDVIAIDDLRIITGHEIKPVIVPDSELAAAIEQFSRATTEVEQEEEVPDLLPGAEVSEERPAVQLANQILHQAVRAGASDVHIEPLEKNMRVRMRIDGVLHEVIQHPRRIHPPLVSRLKVMAGMDIAERRLPQDGRMTMKVDNRTIDVRVASLPSVYGEKLTLRILDRDARLITLEEMGFPRDQLEKYNRIMHLPYGFILVTGPTGSGKSTTLYATLAVLNSVDRHIITLEDPVERRLDGINQIQINLKAGLTFASGLRAIVRNDPDVVMVGEIRDQESARIAVESALTGHLVLATLHTNDAAGAITRLGDMGIEPYLTASSLAGVVAQRLVRVLCPHCREQYELSREELLASVPDFPLSEGESGLTVYKPRGCLRCSNTGYRGRTGVYELLVFSENIRRLTLERRTSHEIKDAAIAEGMITLRRDGLEKVKKGLTSLEEVMRVIV